MAREYLLALDAGHGLGTPGKRCLKSLDPNETSEWWLNDRVCRYIAQRAAQYEGFKTLRVDDTTGKTDVSHKERCRRANAAKADVYHSVHHNAGILGGSGGGLVAFCMRGATGAKVIRDGLYKALIAAGALKGNRASPVLEKNFNVLVWSDMPAVLVEYGFMDSSTDVPVILTEEYAKLVGCATADWYAKYWGLSLIETEKVEEEPEMTKYNTIEEVPDWGKATIQKLVDSGALKGTENGLELSEDMLRILVILDRLGKL